MAKDKQYHRIKVHLKAGELTEFKQIVEDELVNKTRLARDISRNTNRMDAILKNPEKLSCKAIITIADNADVDPAVIFKLVVTQYRNSQKGA